MMLSFLRTASLLGVLALLVVPVQAQTTRAELLIQQRELKEQRLRAPEKSNLEETVEWLAAKGLSPAAGRQAGANVPGQEPVRGPLIRPVFGGLPDGANVTLGVAVQPTRGSEQTLLEFRAAASIRKFWGVGAEAGLERGPLALYGFGRYMHQPRLRFYGFGQDAAEDDRTHFGLDEWTAGGVVGLKPHSRFTLGGHVSYLSSDYDNGAGGAPTTGALFPGAPGLGQDLDYTVYGAFFQFDSRNARFPFDYARRFSPIFKDLAGRSAYPTAGTYLAVEATRYDHLSTGGAPDAFSFDRLEVEVQQYLPFRSGYHALALRHYTSLSQTDDDQAVPFYHMPWIGSARSMRGFPSFRFRDRNVMLFNAEYRWQVWLFMDAALFADVGKVFPEIEDWNAEGLEMTGGFGVRIKANRQLVARLDLALSKEGPYPYFTFSHVF